MDKNKRIFATSIMILPMSICIGQIVFADAIPPAVLYSAVQEDQDLKIGIKIQEGRGNFEVSREIIRIQGDQETTVISNLILADETPVSREPFCGEFYYESVNLEEFCAAYPNACSECDDDPDTTCIGESCDSCIERLGPTFYPGDSPDYDRFCDLYPTYGVDCDGDAENECCMSCGYYLHYDFWDRCVPPGTTDYALHDNSTWDDYSMSTVSPIEVTESDTTCLEAPSTDETESTDSETSVSTDDSDSTDSETSLSTDESPSTDESTSTDDPPSTDEPSSPKASGGGGCSTTGILRSSSSSLSIIELLFN